MNGPITTVPGAATNTPATNTSASNRPASNRPATNRPATNRPATNRPATEPLPEMRGRRAPRRHVVTARQWSWGTLAIIAGGWLWSGLAWIRPVGADDAPAPRTPREGVPPAVAPPEPAAPVRTPAEWVREMESGDDQRIAAATAALEALGPRASAVVPDLVRLLERDDAAHRRHVLAILRALGPAGKEALPAVRAKLFHADFHVQYWACRALAAMGKPDVPLLYWTAAAWALGHVGSIHPELDEDVTV